MNDRLSFPDLILIHTAGGLAESLLDRPIGFGNSTYVDECRLGLGALRKSVDGRFRGRRRPAVIAQLGRHLDDILESGSRETLSRLAVLSRQICDVSRSRSAVYERSPAGLLCGTRYDRVLAVVGPGIGVGDEITSVGLIQAIAERFPGAVLDLYSYCPAIWKTLLRRARVHSLVGQPLAGHKAIVRLATARIGSSVLAIFLSFSGRHTLTCYLRCPMSIDLVEIAVGSGTVWALSCTGGPPMVRHQPDPVHNSLCQHLKQVYAFLAAGDTPKARRVSMPHVPTRRTRRPVFRVVLNPFTSKHVRMQPKDWAGHLSAIRAALVPGSHLHCRIYPGLSSECREFAQAIAESSRQMDLDAKDRIELLGSNTNQRLSSSCAVPASYRAIRASDLLVGMDTFTAHLAARTNTASVTLCLTRNPLFWEDAPNTIWLDTNAGDDEVRGILRWVARLALPGDAEEAIRPYRRACRSLLLQPCPRELVHSALDMLTLRYRHWLQTAETVWRAMPLELRYLSLRFDSLHGWPNHRTALFSSRVETREARKLLAEIDASVFYRLAWLAAR